MPRMSSITRRDFLNGAALTIAAGLTSAAQIAAQPSRYPPALMGLRGQHEGSFEAAHALAREGRRLPIERTPIEETYDLVVVGGGISGLAAAWFYRRARPPARILVLDNHDDFGGHAKRNEFTLDGRGIIGYGAASRCNRQIGSTAPSPRVCCTNLASTSRGSRRLSSAISIRHLGYPAASFSIARRSGATCW